MRWSHGQYGHFACSTLFQTCKKATVLTQNVSIQIVYQIVHFRSKAGLLKSMGKLFPHLVGVFCMHLEPPICVTRKIQVSGDTGQYQEYSTISYYIPAVRRGRRQRLQPLNWVTVKDMFTFRPTPSKGFWGFVCRDTVKWNWERAPNCCKTEMNHVNWRAIQLCCFHCLQFS